jgi:hypothetical protein
MAVRKSKNAKAQMPTKEPTAKRYKKFLALLTEYGNVTKAAAGANVDRAQLYQRRDRHPSFAEAWDAALAIGVAALEDEARRRAFEGWLEPVWHKGHECGAVRKYSDTLLIVLLKAHLPEKYVERLKSEHTGPDGAPLTVKIISFAEADKE